jgi:arylsulfatase
LIDSYPASWDKDREYRGQNGYLPHPSPRAAYAAMITDLDAHVGAVIERLEEHGLSDNTLIIFTSDNGPTHEGRDKNFHIGGADIPFFNSTSGLRGYKGSCYEGGLRVPTIVKWPGKVPPGSESAMPSYFPDWFPTLAAVARIELTTQEAKAIDGQNLLEVLHTGQIEAREAPMVWEFYGYGGILSVRDGDWKLIRRGFLGKKEPSLELYNLATDPKECYNVAEKYPKIAKRLENHWRKTRVSEPDFPFGSAESGSE